MAKGSRETPTPSLQTQWSAFNVAWPEHFAGMAAPDASASADHATTARSIIFLGFRQLPTK